MEANVKKGTRCECTDPKCECGSHFAPLHFPDRCTNLVGVNGRAVATYCDLARDPESRYFNEPHYIPMCSHCATYQEARRDETGIHCDCGKPKHRAAVACDKCADFHEARQKAGAR